MQQTNTALMLLGQVPNPENGERVQDLEGARMFIDQLEMLEAKTKGNLLKQEDQLLKQSLMSLRMAFVQAVEAPAPSSSSAKVPPQPAPSAPTADEKSPTASEAKPADESSDEASRKKFSKKY
jgi:hypothetical protein